MAEEVTTTVNETNTVETKPTTEDTSAIETKPTEDNNTVDNKTDLGPNKDSNQKSDEETKPSTPEVVDENTEFKLPEGYKMNENKLKDFRSIAKELNLSKEQAQKLVDLDSKFLVEAESNMKSMISEWKQKTISELGDNAEVKLGEAATAFKQFGGEELVKLLQETGLENHPAIVKTFINIGSKMQTDKTVSATSGGVKSSITFTEALYGKN